MSAGTTFTHYLGLFGGGGGSETPLQQVVPLSGTFSNLQIHMGLTGAGAPPESVVVTLRKNGVDTPLACTVAAPAMACSNTTESVPLHAGELVSVKLFTTAGGTPSPFPMPGPGFGIGWTASFAPA